MTKTDKPTEGPAADAATPAEDAKDSAKENAATPEKGASPEKRKAEGCIQPEAEAKVAKTAEA